MIRFAHPEFLYLLGAIPAVGLLFWFVLRMRRSQMKTLGNLAVLEKLAESTSAPKRVIRFSILMLAAAMLIIGLANPQIGTRLQEVKQEGVDIFIALDVSFSMKAEDIKPNRLEKAKLEIRSLINRLGGDRVGLIVFAGEAFTQFPLTTDYGAAGLFLDAVDTDVVPTPGTSIGAAIKRAMESFDFEEPSTKVLVIMTDGEATDGDAFEAAKDAVKQNVLIYTVGFGSPTGTPIPVYNSAGVQVDFKRDKDGSVVITKLDEVSLERLALVGKGVYFRGTNSQDELQEIYKNINTLQKREFGVKQFTDYEHRFQFFVAAGILLLLLELTFSEKKTRWIARWNPLRAKEEVKI